MEQGAEVQRQHLAALPFNHWADSAQSYLVQPPVWDELIVLPGSKIGRL